MITALHDNFAIIMLSVTSPCGQYFHNYHNHVAMVSDLSGSGEAGMSRRKSFKKSLRESFRRLRSRRSERHKKVPLGVRAEDEKLRQL